MVLKGKKRCFEVLMLKLSVCVRGIEDFLENTLLKGLVQCIGCCCWQHYSFCDCLDFVSLLNARYFVMKVTAANRTNDKPVSINDVQWHFVKQLLVSFTE